MIEFLTYQIATGRFTSHRIVDTADVRNANVGEGEAWADGTREELRTHYMVGEGKTLRPLVAPETGTAPLQIDLSPLPSPATLRNEAGDEMQSDGIETLTDPGTYWIEPPFPWRPQRVVLA